MDKRKNNNGNTGNSGGGRPSMRDERVIALVVNKSWNRILEKFDKKNKTPDDERALDVISLEIAKKTVPQKLDLTSLGDKINTYSDEQIDRIVDRYTRLRKS